MDEGERLMVGSTPELDRAQVIAYRVAAQQLDRAVKDPAALAVLGLGVQDTPQGSAVLALATRTGAPTPESDALVLTWSWRGAPHLHPRARAAATAAALWPLSDADATARIATSKIKEGAKLGLAAFTAAAEAMHEVVAGKPMAKGAVSTAVSARVPASLTFWCEPCGARHISGSLFQQIGLPAGVELEAGAKTTTLKPMPGRPGVPGQGEGTSSAVAEYLRLLGPATVAHVAKFLGTSKREAQRAWPEDLVEVRVAGEAAWIPADRLDALRKPPKPRLTRLLPASDPYLQAGDRDLIVPDRKHQSVLWKPLGNPGAVLVDGEVLGAWRARAAGKNRLEVSVAGFATLPASVRTEIEAEAEIVAAVRGAGDLRVDFG